MEFNVKDIRTKILHPSEQVSNSRNQEQLDESFVDDSVNASLPNAIEGKIDMFIAKDNDIYSIITPVAFVSSTQSITPQTSVKVDLYIKEFSITLYTDNEENNFLKTELIALYLDEITFFYTDKVHFHSLFL